MSKQYVIVNKKILPDNFEKVIEAKALLDSHSAKDVSDACKKVGLSRSSYYKLKDMVFSDEDEKTTRKVVISCSLNHTQGILSNLLHHIAAHHANVLTITQNYPLQNHAYVVIMLDISDMLISVENLIQELSGIDNVTTVKLISIE